MARTIPGSTRGNNCQYFAGDEIANLKVSAQVVRWRELTPSHVDDLATKIANEGQRNPAWIRRQANGDPELLAGRHRRAAIIKINDDLEFYGLTEPLRFWTVFHDLDDEQCLIASYRENDALPMTIVDMAHAIAHWSDLGWDGKRIADTLSSPHRRVRPTDVSRMKLIHRLPHDIKMALHLGVLTAQAAYLIIGTGGDNEELLETFRQLTAGEISKAELSAMVTGKQREKGKIVKRTMGELTALLGAVVGEKSATMLRWLEGYEDVAGEVLGIFRQDDDMPWSAATEYPVPPADAPVEIATSTEVEVGDEPQG